MEPFTRLQQFLQRPELIAVTDWSAEALFEHTANKPIKLIRSQAGPYLERYFLAEKDGCFAYLHRFVNRDARDEGVHDHPWALAYSQVLHGGYTQLVNSSELVAGRPASLNQEILNPGDSNLIPGKRFHKIISVAHETWTLFVHTEWCRPWGFIHGDIDSGEFRFEIHHSDPNPRWWLDAPLASSVNRCPLQTLTEVA